MKIDGSVVLGNDYIYVSAETVEEYFSAVKKLMEGAPTYFEQVVQVKQAAIAAEVLTKEEKQKASTQIERTKSAAPPNGKKKADEDGCRHGPWTVFDEGTYRYTKYCDGPKDDKCSFAELKAAGIR